MWPSDSQLPTEGQTETLQRGLGHPQAGGPPALVSSSVLGGRVGREGG